MGEKISNRNVNQIILNGLPQSYESTIQTLTHLNATMTFEQLSASLMSEFHCKEHRNQQLGDTNALAASFNQQASLQSLANRGRGRWPQPYRGRGFPAPRSFTGRGYPGSYRPYQSYQQRPEVLICYNCGKNGHYARDC